MRFTADLRCVWGRASARARAPEPAPSRAAAYRGAAGGRQSRRAAAPAGNPSRCHATAAQSTAPFPHPPAPVLARRYSCSRRSRRPGLGSDPADQLGVAGRSQAICRLRRPPPLHGALALYPYLCGGGRALAAGSAVLTGAGGVALRDIVRRRACRRWIVRRRNRAVSRGPHRLADAIARRSGRFLDSVRLGLDATGSAICSHSVWSRPFPSGSSILGPASIGMRLRPMPPPP